MEALNVHIDIDNLLALRVEDFLEKRVITTGMTGSGKSYANTVLLEELMPLVPFAIYDPHGEYFTLAQLFPDIIVAGRSVNAALQISAAQAGALAQWSYQQRRSVVLDLYDVVDENERNDYVEQFFGGLWRALRAVPVYQHQPFGVLLDEAQTLIPENGKETTLYKLMKAFTEQARKFQTIIIASAQRTANISKDYLGACEFRFFLRVSDDADVKAISARTRNAAEAKKLLPELKNGQAIFRSGIMQKVIQIRARHSMSPKTDRQLIERVIAKPDEHALAVLREALDAQQHVVENAEQFTYSDAELNTEIGALRARIHELEGRAPEVVYVAPVTADDLDAIYAKFRDATQALVNLFERFDDVPAQNVQSIEVGGMTFPIGVPAQTSEQESLTLSLDGKERTGSTIDFDDAVEDEPQTPLERTSVRTALVNALKAQPRLQRASEIALWAGLSPISSSTGRALKSLEDDGLILRRKGVILVTAEGRGDPSVILGFTHAIQVRNHWRRQLNAQPSAILTALFDAYPDSLTSEQIALRTPYSLTSSGFARALAALVKRSMIRRVAAATYRVEDVFFYGEEGAK